MSYISPHPNYIKYQEAIIHHPHYKGMPDLKYPDGRIQWEAPSNRKSGDFRFSHERRLKWWKDKAAACGISTLETKWISKVAKLIHPTKTKPCKKCGQEMDIRYCYLNSKFLCRLRELPFISDDFIADERTHIAEFTERFITAYKEQALLHLPKLLKCKAVGTFPSCLHNAQQWITWLWENYIPMEPGLLSPGAMSNAPDRLDGFHSFNLCCRHVADKGRSKKNLQSYASDRRAFEFWSDGNWIEANRLMGRTSTLKNAACANIADGGQHPSPCSADHIGPISLGFCHRPVFRLLCTNCNSAKNNRMTLSDVRHLIDAEKQGETVISWYARPLWDRCKGLVQTNADALKLSKMMRDNMQFAFYLLHTIYKKKNTLFLLSLMNLEIADKKYKIIPKSIQCKDFVVTAEFNCLADSTKNVAKQKARKVRIAIQSLTAFCAKTNRNAVTFSLSFLEHDDIKKDIKHALQQSEAFCKAHQEINEKICQILNSPHEEEKLKQFFTEQKLESVFAAPELAPARQAVCHVMEIFAEKLAPLWEGEPRYSTESTDI